jgi:endonuclease-3 related protein
MRVSARCRSVSWVDTLGFMVRRARFLELYKTLLAAYGPQGWWPANDPFEVIVGAILTQRAAWRNVERAIRALRDAGGLSLNALREAPIELVAEWIRPAVYHNAKARKLNAFANAVTTRHRGDLARFLAQPMGRLRSDLLSIHGIGPETADVILLYAALAPSFVVDTYTRRLVKRLGWIRGDENYETIRSRFMNALPENVGLLSEYHALIVRHGKERCRAVPVCAGCPLGALCSHPETYSAVEGSDAGSL